jgi:uncharacterized protein (DUF2141 family)
MKRHIFLKNITLLIIMAGIILVYCDVVAQAPINAIGTRHSLIVIITKFKNNRGHVNVTVFNSDNGFPKSGKGLQTLYLPINDNSVTAEFTDLSVGDYAVSVYHDENDNKRMDTNFFGIPKEGVGTSNNAKGHFGPPKYRDARFYYNGNNQTIKISINYL